MGRSSYKLRVQAMAKPRLKLIWDTVASQIGCDWSVEQFMPKSTRNVTISTLEKAGVFAASGSESNSSRRRGLLIVDKEYYMITNELMKTYIPRIFTAGGLATASVSADRFLSF
jgi:thioredoxin reductase (NADPH)